MSKKILIGINWFAAALLALALFFASVMPHAFLNREDWVNPPVVIIFTIGLLIIIYGLRKGITLMSDKTYRWVLITLGIVIVIAQIGVALSFIDVARADSYFVRQQAISLAQGSHIWHNYFKVYPNNVNTALFEATLLKPLLKLGITTPWTWLNIVRFLWIDTGLVSGLFLLKKWNFWRPAAFFMMLIWLVSIPVYSYGLYSYNDAIVMPLALNILALGWLFKNKTGKIRWLAGVSSWVLLAFAVVMKSNLIVLWIAVLIILVVGSFAKKVDWKLAVKWLLGSFVMLLTFFSLASMIAKNNGYVKDPNQATPVTSWISMSLNPDKQGQYVTADFYAVRDAKNAAEKKAIADKSIKQRIQQMGPFGLINHFTEKFGVFLSHGDFDGINLNKQWIQAPDGFLAHQRANKFWALILTQSIYTALLVGAIWKLLTQKDNLLATSLMSLFFIGLTAFHVFIWEVEPRYALPLFPIILLFGTIGWATAPKLSMSTSRRFALSGLMTFGVLFSALSIIQMSILLPTKSDPVSTQGIGNYFDPQSENISPNKHYDFNIPLYGYNSNQLKLSTKSTDLVTIVIKSNGRILKQISGQADQIRKINFPTSMAEKLNVSIFNNSAQTVAYESGITNYSITTGRILTKPVKNLLWDVNQVHQTKVGAFSKLTPKQMTPSYVVARNSIMFLFAILLVMWFKPRTLLEYWNRVLKRVRW